MIHREHFKAMKNALCFFSLTGFLIATTALAQSLPVTPTPAKSLVGQSRISAGFADAPDDLKAMIGNREQMEQYLTTNSGSVYAPRLQNMLASGYRQSGRITPALKDWSATWQQLKDRKSTRLNSSHRH